MADDRNWRNNLDDIAETYGVNQEGNWRNDLKAVREFIEAGGGGGGSGLTPAQVQEIIETYLETWQASESNIADGAITEGKIAAAAVTLGKVSTAAVNNAKIVDASINGNTKLVNSSVTTAKIANSAVTAAKIGTSQVLDANIATGAVSTFKLAQEAVATDKIADGAVTAEKIADGVLPEPIVATICPATTVVFAFSEDGSTFSFTGGTFTYLSSKGAYGQAVFGAQINIPYVTGRVIILNLANPSAPTATSRSSQNLVLEDTELVIGNMFNIGTNPLTRVVTVYGAGVYTYSATAGHHEAYGSIANSGDVLDLVLGDYTVRAENKGTTAGISIFATNTDIPNVDIRRHSIYNDASEGKAFDGVTLTSTPLEVDDTVLMQSNDSCTIWLANGRQFFEIKIFISGNGERTRILADFLSQ